MRLYKHAGPCSDDEFRTSRVGGSLSTYATGTIAQLELCVNGMFVAICDPFWDNTEASVLCQQLGFSPYGGLRTVHRCVHSSRGVKFMMHPCTILTVG